MAIKFLCGAECGLAGTGTASGGIEHISATFGSTITNVASPAGFISERCFRFVSTTADVSAQHVYASAIASPATYVARFRVKFNTSLPSQSTCLLGETGQQLGVWFHQPSGELRAAKNGSFASSGIAVTTGVVYLVDVKATKGTTQTVDIRVDGVDGTQFSVGGQTATNGTTIQWGAFFGNPTVDLHMDDIIVTDTSGDYPIGNGVIAGLFPNADGSHTYSAAGDFGDGAGGTTNLATPSSSQTDTWTSLENPLNTSVDTNFVGAIGADVTLTGDRPAEFLRFAFEDLPANAATVRGVNVVITSHSASTTASNIRIHVDDGTNTPPTVLISADMSETTIAQADAIATVAGDGAAWSVSKVNSTFMRFSSSDVNPDVFLDGICLEVDYVPAVDDYPSWHRGNQIHQLLAH